MTTSGPLVRVALLVLLVIAVSGCVEMLDLIESEAYSESDDPRQRAIGAALNETIAEREAEDAVEQYAATGDLRHLEAARRLDPDNQNLLAYELSLARLSGDPERIAAADEALFKASARQIRGETGANTVAGVRRQATETLVHAQVSRLGGSVWDGIERPGPDAPPEQIALFNDLCRTHAELTALGSTFSAVTDACA